MLLLGEAHAQEAPRTITVQNLAPFARREWVGAVVPFARGAVAKLPDLHVGAGSTVWQPIGARWDDGSLRQALCLFPVEMGRLSEVVLPLQGGAGKPLRDVPIVDPVRAGSARVSIHVTLGGVTTEAVPAFVRELEVNAARRVSLFRCRVGGTGLVFELIVEAALGQEHRYAHIGLFFSDPGTQAMQLRIDRAEVRCRGMAFLFRHAGRLAMDTELAGDGSRTVLLQDLVLGDGQGIRRTGALVPQPNGADPLRDQTLQAAALGPVLAATSWRESGAYGPFGVVPAPPPWLRGRLGRAAFARRHAAFVAADRQRGHPLQHFRFALDKNPEGKGNQADFGLLKLSPVAGTGIPSFLLEVEPSVLQEACRPCHFFEGDGSPLQAKNHPKWVQWDGRTHWHCEVSPDRLGKPCPEPRPETSGWRGKDRQHWSSNYLCGFYLLTGSPWALREIENEVQLFLGGQTIHAGTGTSGPGAPRAAGRMLLLGCWLYQCTGDQALLARMHARMERSYLPGFAGRDLPLDRVRPMAIRGPDGRRLGGKVRFWTPWEECMAVAGFAAFHRLTGDTIAWQLAEEISLNALRHGWLVDDRGAHVGYELRFQDGGLPLTREQMIGRDKTTASWAGGGLGEWSMAAVEVALHFARARKDEELSRKAEHILATLRRGRDRPPGDGWWDDYREWDAIAVGR